MVLLSVAAWFVVAGTVVAVAEGKPRAKAKAAVSEGSRYTDDPIQSYETYSTPDDPCQAALNAGHLTVATAGQCWLSMDYFGSLRHRLGQIRFATDALVGLPDIGSNRGPLDFINDQTKAASLKLTTLGTDLATVKSDTASALAVAIDTRTAAQLTATRLDTTNARLSSLGDQLADLEAATSAVANAIDAQGPNLGSPTFPGTSDENPSVVRLASSEFDASELVERSEQSVMFAAGLLAALLVGAMLWRSALGGAA